MKTMEWLPPVWALGLCVFPLSVFGAVMLVTLPQLLAADGVPEPQIAIITTLGLIPNFLSFLLSPLLDWRFRRRTYAIVLAGLAALMQFAALVFIRDLVLLALFLFLGSVAVTLYVATIGGWFGSLIPADKKSRLVCAWFAFANMSGGGLAAMTAIILLRGLPPGVGEAILALLILAPLPLFAFLPAPPADRRLASESFRDFFRDVMALLGKRSVLWTVLLFAMPAASFALTNTLGGLGRDFDASEQFVGIAAGVGLTLGGAIGSLVVPSMLRRIPPRILYLCIGSFGAVFTLFLFGLPRTPTVFALALFGQDAFQAAAFAVENTIILRAIGQNNPLASTQYALLAAAPVFPIAYMQAVDGTAYGVGGLSGSYLADGMISLTACAVLASLFWFAKQLQPATEASGELMR